LFSAALRDFETVRYHTGEVLKIAEEFSSSAHWRAVASANYGCVLSAVLLSEAARCVTCGLLSGRVRSCLGRRQTPLCTGRSSNRHRTRKYGFDRSCAFL
jgi:hypothetical protein